MRSILALYYIYSINNLWLDFPGESSLSIASSVPYMFSLMLLTMH